MGTQETAYIIHPVLLHKNKEDLPDADDKLEEACSLVRAIRLEVVGADIVRLARPTPGYLLGSGKRKEYKADIEELEPDVVIINHPLSPVQQRNLEKEWDCKVIDRTGLILEIFGDRAQTKEGQIQVELAALEYQRSRLVRSWTHLERQRGGAGFMGGPGETQIEIDRRLINDRIAKLKKQLVHVSKNRDLQRRNREKVPYPIVALVGYTNAGKSTLFNKLTGADVFAEDLLFATLDPTMRKLTLTNGQDVILSDTVGFITDLPTHLVAAFKATLEQVIHADIIVHIRNMVNHDTEDQKKAVEQIMHDLGVETQTDNRIIEVQNKIDLLPDDDAQALINRAEKKENVVALSAITGQGVDRFLDMLVEKLSRNNTELLFAIPHEDSGALAWLYEHTHVIKKTIDSHCALVHVDMDPATQGRFSDKFKYQPVTKDSLEDNLDEHKRHQS